MTHPHPTARRTLAFIFYNIVVVLLLVLVLEGIASTYFACREAFATAPVAESLYTGYDRDLGWVNLPNVYLPNMYGPGKYLRTNSQRFRNNADFPAIVLPGKTRIICSGDSFTFGYGVDNDHTWPQLLAIRAPNLETVNMGQGGYGADQAYLWYKRDAAGVDHNIEIFAIILPDLYRMLHSSFNGYGKPVLALENDHLVTTNVPVPRLLAVRSPRLLRLQNALFNLSITRLLRRMLGLDTAAALAETRPERNKELAWLLWPMLDDLRETNRARHSVLVLAYLPTREEYGTDLGTSWRKLLARYAQQNGILYIDLADDFRRLPAAELDKMFIGTGTLNFPGAAGHYTEAGNAFVADLIYRRLIANPQTAAKFNSQSTNVAP